MDIIKIEPEETQNQIIQTSNTSLPLKTTAVKKAKGKNAKKSVPSKIITNDVKGNNSFQCKVCPYNTYRKPFLDKHMLQKHGFYKVNDEKKSGSVISNSHETMGCKEIKNNVEMEGQTQWESHNRYESVELGCKQCNFKTTHLNLLNIHEEIHVGNKDFYQCVKCKFTTEDANALQEHEKIHNELILYNCMNCDYATRQKCNLRQHVRVHLDPRKVEKYSCSHCLYSFFHYSALMRHIRRKHNTDEEVFKCDKCSYTSTMQQRLTDHQKFHDTHDDMPMFKCEECDFVTYKEVTIQKHVQRHKERQKDGEELIVKEQMNEKELVWFCCNMCNFRAKEQRYVMLHKKVHERVNEINKVGESVVQGEVTKMKIENGEDSN